MKDIALLEGEMKQKESKNVTTLKISVLES